LLWRDFRHFFIVFVTKKTVNNVCKLFQLLGTLLDLHPSLASGPTGKLTSPTLSGLQPSQIKIPGIAALTAALQLQRFQLPLANLGVGQPWSEDPLPFLCTRTRQEIKPFICWAWTCKHNWFLLGEGDTCQTKFSLQIY